MLRWHCLIQYWSLFLNQIESNCIIENIVINKHWVDIKSYHGKTCDFHPCSCLIDFPTGNVDRRFIPKPDSPPWPLTSVFIMSFEWQITQHIRFPSALLTSVKLLWTLASISPGYCLSIYTLKLVPASVMVPLSRLSVFLLTVLAPHSLCWLIKITADSKSSIKSVAQIMSGLKVLFPGARH